jgi:acyl carrier protein
MAVRSALLSIVDAIEKKFGITPRTSLLRKEK